MVRDLFDADPVFIEDPALLTKLAEDKLAGSRKQFLADGRGWVELNLGTGSYDGQSALRVHPQWRDPTEEEQAELDRLTAEVKKLDSELDENATDDDLRRWSTRDDLEAAYETIRQAARFWDASVKPMCRV